MMWLTLRGTGADLGYVGIAQEQVKQGPGRDLHYARQGEPISATHWMSGRGCWALYGMIRAHESWGEKGIHLNLVLKQCLIEASA